MAYPHLNRMNDLPTQNFSYIKVFHFQFLCKKVVNFDFLGKKVFQFHFFHGKFGAFGFYCSNVDTP